MVLADYWVLAIAICTYMILSGRRAQSAWLHDHKVVIWALTWLPSLLWATLGLMIVGYSDIGACKSLTPSARTFQHTLACSLLTYHRVLVYQRQDKASCQLYPTMAHRHCHSLPVLPHIPFDSQDTHRVLIATRQRAARHSFELGRRLECSPIRQ